MTRSARPRLPPARREGTLMPLRRRPSHTHTHGRGCRCQAKVDGWKETTPVNRPVAQPAGLGMFTRARDAAATQDSRQDNHRGLAADGPAPRCSRTLKTMFHHQARTLQPRAPGMDVRRVRYPQQRHGGTAKESSACLLLPAIRHCRSPLSRAASGRSLRTQLLPRPVPLAFPQRRNGPPCRAGRRHPHDPSGWQ